MKYIIFSDVHSNLEALKKFLSATKRLKNYNYLFLGDIVGYGAQPNEVIELLKTLTNLKAVRGNHDKAVLEPAALEFFNPVAAQAVEWTRENLTESSMKFLASLPAGPLKINEEICICHGAPFDEDYYIFSQAEAEEAMKSCEGRICFFGHTHVPIVYEFKTFNDVAIYYPSEDEVEIKLVPSFRYLINPGSIGQPRDMNPKLSFAIYNTKKGVLKFKRIPYNWRRAKKKILKAGLPPTLAERLEAGL